jgi:hypothetical protein
MVERAMRDAAVSLVPEGGHAGVVTQDRAEVRHDESTFLGIVAEGLGEAPVGWWPLEGHIETDSMYVALTWIVKTIGDMMEADGKSVTKREILEATGSMILGWDLLEAESEWRSNWAPDEGLETAFVQICRENGFDVVDMSLQESAGSN